MIRKFLWVMIITVGCCQAMFRGHSATVYPETAVIEHEAQNRRPSAPVYRAAYRLVINPRLSSTGSVAYEVVELMHNVINGSFRARSVNDVVMEISDLDAVLPFYFEAILKQILKLARSEHYRQIQIIPHYFKRSEQPTELKDALKALGFRLGEKRRWVKDLNR